MEGLQSRSPKVALLKGGPMDTLVVLRAIPSTEPADFGEFCNALEGDKPDDRQGWSDLFNTIRSLEREGLIEVSHAGNLIDTLVLTEAGVARVKAGK